MASSRAADAVLRVGLGGAAAVGAIALSSLLVVLVLQALPVLDEPARLLDTVWRPSQGRLGLLPLLVGSLVVALGAMALAIPLGVGIAVFGRELAPRGVGVVMRRVLVLMAATPSVVIGVWALTALVPWLGRWHPPGASVMAACLVLAWMMVPTMALLVDGALAQVPRERRLAAAALGLSRSSTVRHVVLPHAAPAIGSAAAVAAARALGETMAVLLVSGNVAAIPDSPWDPVRVMTANIALELPYARGDHRAALFATGLAMAITAAALLGLAHLVARRSAAGA